MLGVELEWGEVGGMMLWERVEVRWGVLVGRSGWGDAMGESCSEVGGFAGGWDKVCRVMLWDDVGGESCSEAYHCC